MIRQTSTSSRDGRAGTSAPLRCSWSGTLERWPDLRRPLARRGDVHDVVQDTFVRAFASLDSFRGDSSLRTWLFTIARRLLLDLRRSERRRGEQVEVQEHDASTEYDSLDSVVAEETRRRMHTAVAKLSKTQREVFMLRVTEGLSYKEIADVAGTTEGAARVHYHNAMRAIKEFLHE